MKKPIPNKEAEQKAKEIKSILIVNLYSFEDLKILHFILEKNGWHIEVPSQYKSTLTMYKNGMFISYALLIDSKEAKILRLENNEYRNKRSGFDMNLDYTAVILDTFRFKKSQDFNLISENNLEFYVENNIISIDGDLNQRLSKHYLEEKKVEKQLNPTSFIVINGLKCPTELFEEIMEVKVNSFLDNLNFELNEAQRIQQDEETEIKLGAKNS